MKVKRFGPYKGSKQNGGRAIYVFKKLVGGKWITTSSNKARVEYEESTGKTLPRNSEVDHKNNKGRAGDDRMANLRVLNKSENVALENKRRTVKKAVAKKAAPQKKTIKKAVKKK
jgi:hypothetical protein